MLKCLERVGFILPVRSLGVSVLLLSGYAVAAVEDEQVAEESVGLAPRWQGAPEFTPPFHIAADGHGDLGARFVDLNGDGRQDFVFHRWINSSTVQKGAYLSTGAGWQWATEFTPPFHIAADGQGDLGARFVDLNGDGRQDFVFHRWIYSRTVQKGAYINTP
ncbi:VCBS repeat-containing protein [Archangium sp.]|uniref:FG-GAP repeat domain-containing protein n=1 Tax=Archangium sp. TaxID=1872627 RepID=UPI002D49EE76|nr:VCBS repeat-containing protein [Archangium sp.]HYO55692.1 VCBS repeat-containing protein [Archangium sp.]